MLGVSTSEMSVKEMTEMIEICHYFGATHGVVWSPASIAMDFERVE